MFCVIWNQMSKLNNQLLQQLLKEIKEEKSTKRGKIKEIANFFS